MTPRGPEAGARDGCLDICQACLQAAVYQAREEAWQAYHEKVERVKRVHGHPADCLWTDCDEHEGCQGALPCTCGRLPPPQTAP